VEFSPEDASRTELAYLADVVTAAIEAGATTVNIPDTVGYTVPAEFDRLFRYLKDNVPGIEDITLSVHCHDDLGMAVANSLAAVIAGARQVECTINGIGERAGNCSLEEIVMALKTRAEFFELDTAIDRRFRAIRRSSAKTRSPMKREFTSTACCSIIPHTRSCGRATSVSANQTWLLANTVAVTHFGIA
jgi:isopropylmalate/homocitrate/citramalate synthase